MERLKGLKHDTDKQAGHTTVLKGADRGLGAVSKLVQQGSLVAPGFLCGTAAGSYSFRDGTSATLGQHSHSAGNGDITTATMDRHGHITDSGDGTIFRHLPDQRNFNSVHQQAGMVPEHQTSKPQSATLQRSLGKPTRASTLRNLARQASRLSLNSPAPPR